MKESLLIIFVPALHKGYIDLFKKYPNIAVISRVFLQGKYTSLERDLRFMEDQDTLSTIKGLPFIKSVQLFSEKELKEIPASTEIILTKDEISEDIAKNYLSKNKIKYESVFLRWNKQITQIENVIPAHRTITADKAHQELMGEAMKETEKSPDWWRQIATVVVKEGKIIYKEHNHTLPHEHAFSVLGDPRSNFDAGQQPGVYLTIHSEAAAIAHAAHDGVSLDGAVIYVTTFPCPNCARLLTKAGIKKVYYAKGYSLLDAENILNEAGVEIVLVSPLES